MRHGENIVASKIITSDVPLAMESPDAPEGENPLPPDVRPSLPPATHSSPPLAAPPPRVNEDGSARLYSDLGGCIGAEAIQEKIGRASCRERV